MRSQVCGRLAALRLTLRYKMICLLCRRASHQHPCQDDEREKCEHASLAGEVRDCRRVVGHHCAGEHPQDRVECAMRDHHRPEAAGLVAQIPVKDSGNSEHREEERNYDQPVANRVVRSGEQHQRQVPHTVQKADERGCQPWIARGQLGQQVATPADLLEEGEERDDHNIDGEVDRGVRLETPGHLTKQGHCAVRRDEYGGRTEQSQRPVPKAGAVQGEFRPAGPVVSIGRDHQEHQQHPGGGGQHVENLNGIAAGWTEQCQQYRHAEGDQVEGRTLLDFGQ
jgi:hypothetical protein